MNVEQLQERIDHLDKWAQGRLPPQTAVDFGYVLEAARLVANGDQIFVDDSDEEGPTWVRSEPDGPVWAIEPGSYRLVALTEGDTPLTDYQKATYYAATGDYEGIKDHD